MKKEVTIKINIDENCLASNMQTVGQEISYTELFGLWDYITFILLNNSNDVEKCLVCMDGLKEIRKNEVIKKEK